MIRGSLTVPIAIQSVAHLAEHNGQKGNGLRQGGILSSDRKGVSVMICGKEGTEGRDALVGRTPER
jgi:hypothetical protein